MEGFAPDAETNGHHLSTMTDSNDSEEESSQEEPPVTCWSELSIIERVGLNSVDMTEKDLETAFSQIALAFRCDQYTLKQRLQSEEHARNLAEENIHLELSRGRETLETLKGLCLDSKRSSILQRLELSLDILGGTVERISSTAEVLGAVHQEARVSRAVELMVAHVESLRRRHDRHLAELEEAKNSLQQQQQQLSSCRHSNHPRTIPEPERQEDRKRRNSNQSVLRRRVSASIISSPNLEKKKRDSRKRTSSWKKNSPPHLSPSLSLDACSSVFTQEDSHLLNERQPNPDPPGDCLVDLSAPSPESHPTEEMIPSNTHNRNLSLDSLRQRQKAKAAALIKGKERKTATIQRQISIGTYGSPCRQDPLLVRLHRCRWARICTNLFVLFCVVMLTCIMWKIHEGEAEP
ncbi:PREDICTED: lymphoid-restricted membrane protein-like isoform X2 [Poecilia mexicana]|uniref:lymphoid-restricted membrane protein-like isoform X2 n=1 Tax=Poecilia mexicana TaxID=48701 RepID=UPI00072EE962|nr:PREDICTED: lymphoid-restricted membrane protein-like isoform X2 [Poecilia mexicana]XP_016529143.1 PREDICTED: lymphoid-restricted membrane protein-like isoform X2 [Poecilia formosa]